METPEQTSTCIETKNSKPEIPLDAVHSASSWSKVSKKSVKYHAHLYWLLGGLVAVIFVLILSYHSNTVIPKKTMHAIEDTDYRASLRANLAHLSGLDDEQNSETVTVGQRYKTFQYSEIKSKPSKAYLARQNAPTSMYANPFSKMGANTPQEMQQAILADPGANAQFANANTATTTVEAKPLPHPDETIAQGTIIQAVLETAINSDLPGMVRAVVSRPVYAYTHERLIIPAGSRLIGQYASALVQGQNRVMIIWQRIMLPSGIAVPLHSPGTDPLGRAGQGADTVDTHFLARFSQAALLSLIGAGTASVGAGDHDNSAASYRTGVAQSFQQSAQQSLQGTAALKPTLHIHQGTKIHVFVAHDISFYHVLKGWVALPAPLPSLIQ